MPPTVVASASAVEAPATMTTLGSTTPTVSVDESVKRSRRGLRAVSLSLGVLAAAAAAQLAIFLATGSIALLADLIHNFGDASTAIPLGIAFLLRSRRAERYAGLFVVLAIFVSACVAGVEAVSRLMNPEIPTHLGILAAAGAIGFAGPGSPRSSEAGRGASSTAPRSSRMATTPEPTPT